MDLIIAAYCAIGVGMCAKLLTHHNILYKEKGLTQPQYILFVFLFCSLWPARFSKIAKLFRTVNKDTGIVLPL